MMNVIEKQNPRTMGANKRIDHDPVVFLLRLMSDYTARMLSRTRITPNQVTVFNFILLVPPILYLISRGTFIGNLAALALIGITVVLDLSDGALARLTKTYSNHGAWLDKSLDAFFQFSLLAAVSLGVYRNTGEEMWLILGLGMLLGQNMANYMGSCFEKDYGFDGYEGSRTFDEKWPGIDQMTVMDGYLKNIIVPSRFLFIFLFTARYWLVLGMVFNRLDLFLIVFTVTIHIRWISMYLLYLKTISGAASRLYSIRFLREIDGSRQKAKKI